MNITKQKWTHREQITGYQRGEESSEGQVRGRLIKRYKPLYIT